LTDKKGIPLSVVISSASAHDINLVTDVADNMVIKRPKSISSSKPRSGRRRKRRIQKKASQILVGIIYPKEGYTII
jgi:hypothetical protein